MTLDHLLGFIEKGFVAATLTSPSALRDDDQVRVAAQLAYALIPPHLRILVRLGVGEKGFERFVFRVRDLMLSEELADFRRLTSEGIQSLLARASPTAGKLDISGAIGPSAAPTGQFELTAAQSSLLAPPTEAGGDWCLRRGEEQSELLSNQEFLKLLEGGAIEPTDLVWHRSQQQWMTLAEAPSVLATARNGRT